MDELSDFFGFVGAFALLSLLIVVFVFGIVFIIPAGTALAIGMVIYSHYSPNSQRNKDQALIAETHQLYKQAEALSPIDEQEFKRFAAEQFESEQLFNVAVQLFEMEGYATPPAPPPIVTGIEGGRYRDELKRYINVAHDQAGVESFKRELVEALAPFDRVTFTTGFFTARRYLTNDEIDGLAHSFFGEHQHFKELRAILDRNFNEQNAVLPRDYKGDNCLWDYLKDTPLLEMEYQPVEVQWFNRASHTLILAGSGAGKTTLFKHMIARLLQENCCVVVMDSQTQLIEELAHIKLDDEEVTWISPEHRLALNPFDVDEDDLKDEAVINNKISLLEFVVEHLIKAEMTPRQKNLFYHCCQLVFTIPDANVETFKEVLADPYEFAEYIDELDATSRKFFNTELIRETGLRKKGSYDSTREELSYRLDGLIKQTTFRRIFQTAENTFDFYTEVQDRKLILIDTNVGLLADDSPTFGRLFVAQSLQACFERVRNKETSKPVYFFVDEAHEIFDEKMERMLLQARKANVGMVLATQDFSRASKSGITDTLIGSTATKIISQVGLGDAKRLAARMKCSPDFLTSLPQYSFAFASGDQDTVSIRADGNPLSDLEMHDDLKALRKEMEYHYGPEPDAADIRRNSEKSQDGPTGKYGPNDELKPEPGRKKTQNEDHDIVPGDTL